MLNGILAKENSKNLLEKRSFESLVICNSLALSCLPIRGESILDLSKNGEFILVSNKSTICLAHTLSHLYNPLLRHNHNANSCCCDSYSIKYTPPRSNIVTKLLKYKTRCTSSLWYSTDNSIFLTGGDTKIDVWDSSVPEIAYSFSNLPSLVNYLAVATSNSVNPTIAGGLSCGTISLCDTRYGSSSNSCKPKFSASISVMKFLKHNENQIIAAYENSSVLIWDLRRFNRPLCSLSNRVSSQSDSIIAGCSFNSGPLVSKLIREKHSFDFKTEDELWRYIKEHDSDIKRSNSQNLDDIKFPISKNRAKPTNRKKTLDLSIHKPSGPLSQLDFNKNEPQPPVSFEKTAVSTDIKISDLDLNIYISHKNGIIETYNHNTFKLINTIDVNSFNDLIEWENPQKKYSQKMKIELICQDSFLIYNNIDSIGIINLKDFTLKRYIKMKNKESDRIFAQTTESVLSEDLDVSCSATGTTQSERASENTFMKGVCAISTIPSIREIYIMNESGQLFVLHPDYKKLFK